MSERVVEGKSGARKDRSTRSRRGQGKTTSRGRHDQLDEVKRQNDSDGAHKDIDPPLRLRRKLESFNEQFSIQMQMRKTAEQALATEVQSRSLSGEHLIKAGTLP
eukprot:750180-Hanusia_phi.AAC.6